MEYFLEETHPAMKKVYAERAGYKDSETLKYIINSDINKIKLRGWFIIFSVPSGVALLYLSRATPDGTENIMNQPRMYK